MKNELSFAEFERTGWNGTANVYDTHFGRHTIKYCDSLLQAAHVSEGFRVLDLACGPGYVSTAAALLGATPLGIDFAANMIAQAKIMHPSLQFEIGDAEKLALKDDTFDAVVMGFGMLHLENPSAAAREAWRVLHNNGRFAFSVWGDPEHVCIGTGIVLAALQEHANLDLGLPEGPPMFRFSDPKESEALLSAAGFTNISVAQVDFPWILDSPGELLDAFLEAGVRAGVVLRAQSKHVQKKIKEQTTAQAEQFLVDGKFVIPMGAVITSGQKSVRD